MMKNKVNSYFKEIVQKKETVQKYHLEKGLFLTLDKASNSSNRISDHCICIFGLTRSGKSTTYNLLKERTSLIGKDEANNTYYIIHQKFQYNPELAEISSSMKSVTIMPNVFKKKKGNLQITYIDFGGFGQRRDQTQVLQVNFYLSQFLYSIKKMKSIIVMTESSFNDIGSNNFKNTFQEFFQLISIDEHAQQDRIKFYSSISLYITSVTIKKNYSTTKGKFLEQLKENLIKLSELYKSNNNEMTKFPIAQELISNIIKSQRLELFPEAVDNQSPLHHDFIDEFDKKGWTYYEMMKNQSLIKNRYETQFKTLAEEGQKEIQNTIKWRFNFCQKSRAIIVNIILTIIDKVTSKNIDLSQEFNNLKQLYNQIPEYGEYKQYLTFQPTASIQQRLVLLQKLPTTMDLQKYPQWQQQNPDKPSTAYYKEYMAQKYLEQMKMVNSLISQQSRHTQILNQIVFNIMKMFPEAAIFEKLSKQFGSNFKNQFNEKINLVNEIQDIRQIQLKIIKQVSGQKYEAKQFTSKQVASLIAIVEKIKKKQKQAKPTVYYSIFYRLKYLLAECHLHENKILLSMQQFVNALVIAIKYHLCLVSVNLKSNGFYLLKIQQMQAQAMSQLGHLVQFYPNNKQLIKIIYFLSSQIKKLNVGYNSMNIINALNDFSKITKIVTDKINTNQIINEYHSSVKDEVLQEKYWIEWPTNYSISAQLQVTENIKAMIKNKNVILILGDSLAGKTVVSYIFRNKKLVVDQQSRLDLEYQSDSNRINHTGNPYNFINVVPQDQNLVMVEFPSFMVDEIYQRFIRLSLVQSILQVSASVKIVIVQKQQRIKQKRRQFIRFVSKITNLLNIQLDTADVLKHSIILILNYSEGKLPEIKKNLKENIITPLQSKQNQQFGLTQVQKDNVVSFINFLVKQGKILTLGKNNLQSNQALFNNTHQQDLKWKLVTPSMFQQNSIKIYRNCLKVDEQKLLAEQISQKGDLIKKIFQTTKKLILKCFDSFVEGEQCYIKSDDFDVLLQILSDPRLNSYNADRISTQCNQYISLNITNKTVPKIYSGLMQILQKGQFDADLFLPDDYYVFYTKLEAFINMYLKNTFYLCCSNQKEEIIYFKIIKASSQILKEIIQYVPILTTILTSEFDQGELVNLSSLDQHLRMRQIIDQNINSLDYRSIFQDLIQKCNISIADHRLNQANTYLMSIVESCSIFKFKNAQFTDKEQLGSKDKFLIYLRLQLLSVINKMHPTQQVMINIKKLNIIDDLLPYIQIISPKVVFQWRRIQNLAKIPAKDMQEFMGIKDWLLS